MRHIGYELSHFGGGALQKRPDNAMNVYKSRAGGEAAAARKLMTYLKKLSVENHVNSCLARKKAPSNHLGY